MSTDYGGLPGNIGTIPSLNIASSTNANPIVVQTSAPHPLTTGDRVVIADHTVNYAANGIWDVTVLTVTTFSIPAVGVGLGGATGTVQALGHTPQRYNIPSDGDNADATSVNVPFEALGDRTAWLMSKLAGGCRAIYKVLSVASNHDDTETQNGTVALAGGSFNQISNAKWTIPGLANGDAFVVFINCNLAGSGTAAQVAVGRAQYAPGQTPPAPSLGGSAKAVDNTIRGYQFAVLDTYGLSGGSVDISLQAFTSGAGSAAFYGDFDVLAFILR